jgi:hypothetical protein
MVEQGGFEFDPVAHRQPPPVVPIREGIATAPQLVGSASNILPSAAPRPAPPSQPGQQRLFSEPVQQVTPAYVATAKVVAQILATRVLLMIAVITASGVWAYTIYDPLQLRIIAASSFSVLGVAPLIWLYVKKG